MGDTLRGWYFAAADRRLRYGDGRKIRVGTAHTVDCEPKLCKAGLHASKRIIDALRLGHGPIVYRVELSDDIVRGDDKACARRRDYLWGFDATDVLRAWSRKCALRVVHLWDAPEIVTRYLKTGDPKLRDEARRASYAASTASDAASTASDAASTAADAAHAAAPIGALRAAAIYASCAADAAHAAAHEAERAWQNRMLERMVRAARYQH